MIWGIKKEEDENNIQRAQYLLSKLSTVGARVIVPAIALGETLSGCEDSKRPDFLRRVQEKVIIAPYDAVAAYHYAEMWRKRESVIRGVQANDSSIEFTRNKLKADFMIVATAKAQNAACIYTSEGELNVFRGFAKHTHPAIPVEPMPPTPPVQPNLLEMLP